MNRFIDLYKKFVSIPKEFSENVSEKNQRFLKIIFTFAISFGVIVFPIVLCGYFFSHREIPVIIFIYYCFIIAAGSLGLILLKNRIPSSILIFYSLICAEVIIDIHLCQTPFTNAVVIFIGILFVFIMLLLLLLLVYIVTIKI